MYKPRFWFTWFIFIFILQKVQTFPNKWKCYLLINVSHSLIIFRYMPICHAYGYLNYMFIKKSSHKKSPIDEELNIEILLLFLLSNMSCETENLSNTDLRAWWTDPARNWRYSASSTHILFNQLKFIETHKIRRKNY